MYVYYYKYYWVQNARDLPLVKYECDVSHARLLLPLPAVNLLGSVRCLWSMPLPKNVNWKATPHNQANKQPTNKKRLSVTSRRSVLDLKAPPCKIEWTRKGYIICVLLEPSKNDLCLIHLQTKYSHLIYKELKPLIKFDHQQKNVQQHRWY